MSIDDAADNSQDSYKSTADTGNLIQDSSNTALSEGEGNFTELSQLINASSGVLELDKDYVYNSGDTVGTAGIKINNPITINGNGHSIDASSLARIFNIAANNVILNNITFVNSNCSGSGGAILISGANCTIKDCTFENNTASSSGGAIYTSGDKTTIQNCNFEKNNASSYGGAIYSYGTNTKIDNCDFSDNTANTRGGAVYSTKDNLTANNSNFDNNKIRRTSFSTSYGGGAVYSTGSYSNFSNSNFTNNEAGGYGGAVRIDGSYSTMNNSRFESNSGGDGGAVAWHGSYGNLDNCSFFSNFASTYDGGGLSWYSSNGNASNSLFENNTATFRGAGVISQTSNAKFDNLTFIGNNASSGAGLFAPSTSSSNTINNNGIILNSKFINNHAFYGGGGADVTAHFKIVNSTFENNTANNYGGAVSLAYAEIINSSIINNNASFGGGIYSYNSTVSNTSFSNNDAPTGKSAYVINSTEFIDCDISDDDIVTFEDVNKTQVKTDGSVDNLFNTTDGYYAYCAERFVDQPYEGVHDNSLKLLKNAKNGQPVGEYLKILIYQYVDKFDDLKDYSFEDYVWAFTDFEYWNSDDPIIKNVIELYDSGFRVPTENACKVLPNGTLMYFDFSSLITPTAQQNLFLFKLDYGGIMDGSVSKETLNETVLVGDNAEFRIVVDNKADSIIYDVFVEDKDYSKGLQYENWRSEIGNWTYDNLTNRWRLDQLESGESASLILIFKAKVNGTLINNVSSGIGNVVLFNASNTTDVYSPGLTVEKKALNKTIEIGKEAKFEIVVKNIGEIDLDNVFVLESDFASGLVYLDYSSIKGNWIHSLNDEGKHLFTLNETLKINDTASLILSFNTTKTGNLTNHVEAGVNDDNNNVSDSSDSIEVIENDYPDNSTDSDSSEDDENEDANEKIDENENVDENKISNEIGVKSSKLGYETGNPIFILLLALISIPIRMLKK